MTPARCQSWTMPRTATWVIACCVIVGNAYAQGRPMIVWSTNRANLERLDPANGDTDIYVMDNLGRDVRRLTDDEGDEGYPSWSPDGKRVVFTHSIFENGFRRRGMYIVDADGGNRTPFEGHPDGGGMPSWSPTGKQIVFGSGRGRSSNIYVANVDGSGLRNVTRGDAHNWYPTWSPDGTQIAFSSNRDTGSIKYHIHVIDIDGRNERALTDGKWDGLAPSWSPDGSEIAYWGRSAGNVTLIVPADGGPVRRMSGTVEGEDHPSWSPNGRQIAFSLRGDIWVFDIDTDRATNLTNSDGASHHNPKWFDPSAPGLTNLAVDALGKLVAPWARLKRR